jgi:hypothetical protein
VDEQVQPGAGFDRRELLRLGGFLAALLLIAGAIMLITGGGSDSKAGGPVTQAQAVGVLTEVSAERLVLQPSDGSAPIQFTIRPQDARTIDLFHLQQHSQDQLQSIVFYETDREQKYVLRVDDA